MASLDLGKVVGSRIHHVNGAPAAALGLENDWALDTDSGAVYEKTGEGWTARGSFRGEKGETGAQGPQGLKGDPGEQGPQGEAGPAGVDGKTPTLSIDENGHLIATYE